MKFYITYFYNIRFFNKNILPLSTAMYDPKWFHEDKDQSHIFKDKNGVYNGLRIEALAPYKINNKCEKDCSLSPNSCSFIKNYRNYLDTLNFREIYDLIMNYAGAYSKLNDNKLPDVCLLVHEKPDNPCSERKPLMDWFKSNGVELIEYSPTKCIGFNF